MEWTQRTVDAALWRIPTARQTLAARTARRERSHIRSAMTNGHHFAGRNLLPKNYGRGLSERAVEFGWFMAQDPYGYALDAGSTLNHSYVLDNVLPVVERLTVVTLVQESRSFPERGVMYAYHDLRSLPFADHTFDTVVSLSVLEHVGLDNSRYGADVARGDPQEEACRAMRELARVAKPGACFVISVPFGRSQMHDWVRVVDRAQLDELIAAAEPSGSEITVYRDTGRGWQVTSVERAANAEYRSHQAEAVACVRLTLA